METTLPALSDRIGVRLGNFKLNAMTAIDAIDSPESFIELDGWLDGLKKLVRELDAAKDAKGLEVVRTVGQFQCGTKRWYEGTETKVKPRLSPAALIHWLREKLMGDEEAVDRCLSASAVKQGQAKKELEAAGCPEAFHEAFESEVVNDLATGKPVKSLKCIDTRYVD